MKAYNNGVAYEYKWRNLIRYSAPIVMKLTKIYQETLFKELSNFKDHKSQ